MGKRLCQLLTALLMAEFAVLGTAYGQARGGMPGGIPTSGGMPGGLPTRGPPDWVGASAGQARSGLDRAETAQEQRLSRQQTDRAAALAKAAPQDYELDRNGALAIRSEVLVTGLDAAQLARIERAGFSVLRRSEIPELGISLAVVTLEGTSATRALERLRRLAPEGSYDLNHVYFESGARETGSPGPARVPTANPEGAAVVGLIDTGVAATVESNPRIRVLRQNFAPGGSTPAIHGTAVATLLARDPGRVTIYAADIFGVGPRGGTAELLVRALGWMTGQRVPVINVSMVGPANGMVFNVVQAMIGRGFTIVAPVGNDGAGARLLYPASYPGVVAVSAAGADGRLLPEASHVKRVDFVGPGIATVPDLSGRATVVRGTSFAAPIVARRIADRVRVPDPASARQAIALLSKSATRPRSGGSWYGRGVIGVTTTERER